MERFTHSFRRKLNQINLWLPNVLYQISILSHRIGIHMISKEQSPTYLFKHTPLYTIIYPTKPDHFNHKKIIKNKYLWSYVILKHDTNQSYLTNTMHTVLYTPDPINEFD